MSITIDDSSKIEVTADTARKMIADALSVQFPNLTITVGTIEGERHPDDVVVRAIGHPHRGAVLTDETSDEPAAPFVPSAETNGSILAIAAIDQVESKRDRRVLVICPSHGVQQSVRSSLFAHIDDSYWRGDSLFLRINADRSRLGIHVCIWNDPVPVGRTKFDVVVTWAEMAKRVDTAWWDGEIEPHLATGWEWVTVDATDA